MEQNQHHQKLYFLIADEPDLRAIFKESIIALYPHSVIVEANRAIEAVQKASRQTFHLIIMDLKGTGKESLKPIEILERMTENMPKAVLIVSADILPEQEAIFKKKGIDYLKKPCTGDSLSHKIKALIEPLLLK